MSGVKCLAGAGGFIASGGGDDLVRCAQPAAAAACALLPCAYRASLRSRSPLRIASSVSHASLPRHAALRCRALRCLRPAGSPY